MSQDMHGHELQTCHIVIEGHQQDLLILQMKWRYWPQKSQEPLEYLKLAQTGSCLDCVMLKGGIGL